VERCAGSQVSKYRVKLTSAATAASDMLKGAAGEECLLRTSVCEWRTRLKQGRGS
jgi:hypothetical protein